MRLQGLRVDVAGGPRRCAEKKGTESPAIRKINNNNVFNSYGLWSVRSDAPWWFSDIRHLLRLTPQGVGDVTFPGTEHIAVSGQLEPVQQAVHGSSVVFQTAVGENVTDAEAPFRQHPGNQQRAVAMQGLFLAAH